MRASKRKRVFFRRYLGLSDMAYVAPSILAADFSKIEDEVLMMEGFGAQYIHLDVMDGEFVPNFGLGVDYIRNLRDLTSIPLDLHLMIKNPEYKLQWIGIRETDIVSIHYESTYQVQRALDWLKPYKCKRFLAINPATPIYVLEEVMDHIDGINLLMVNPGFAGQRIVPSTIKKADKLMAFLVKNGKNDDISVEVDGNITEEYGGLLSRIGANLFVCGSSSIFRGPVSTYTQNISRMRNSIGSFVNMPFPV